MSSKRINLIILIGIICYTCPLLASAQATPSASQSSTTKTGKKETKKREAKSLSKSDSEKKPNPSQNEKKKTAASADKPEKKLNRAKQKRAPEQKRKDQRFVDRDGDGIHDGMEHRFRRKHKKAHSNKNTDSRGRHLRQQRRKGAQGPSNRGK